MSELQSMYNVEVQRVDAAHRQLLIQPGQEGVDLIGWVAEHRDWIVSELHQAGGILFRDFTVPSIDYFEQVSQALTPTLEEYKERSTPRSEVQGKIYTSTEYPADQFIPLHNENSYTHAWPLKIWFHCAINARTGGETPIADSREVYARISPQIRERFADKKLMYVRNVGGGIDLPWQTVFQTDSREEVNAYCKKVQIEVEWLGEDRLRTRSVRGAIAKHPATWELLWFNQAHLFHVSSLPEELRDYMVAAIGEENLPRNVYYGDGSPIEQSILDEIRGVYDETMLVFPWQQGDIVLLDNMLNAHGRNPYTGDRKVVVAMAEPWNQYGL
ncbi:taurine catabolism dioxygenase TauD [Paenibacillus sp. 598K]|uniref:TauD/TfdA family dioxygenase n=1 Tax=Paenibacillus sp. 598K TaxID=1117987 RepID=UPI000FFA4920|nr:TauD/TfdA family dioxygenase [Paenibacillus sp. 598K]GBF78222.1 taurine catabolism dioxygenase TauD [Paenibacillus sp. 598K]